MSHWIDEWASNRVDDMNYLWNLALDTELKQIYNAIQIDLADKPSDFLSKETPAHQPEPDQGSSPSETS